MSQHVRNRSKCSNKCKSGIEKKIYMGSRGTGKTERNTRKKVADFLFTNRIPNTQHIPEVIYLNPLCFSSQLFWLRKSSFNVYLRVNKLQLNGTLAFKKWVSWSVWHWCRLDSLIFRSAHWLIETRLPVGFLWDFFLLLDSQSCLVLNVNGILSVKL